MPTSCRHGRGRPRGSTPMKLSQTVAEALAPRAQTYIAYDAPPGFGCRITTRRAQRAWVFEVSGGWWSRIGDQAHDPRPHRSLAVQQGAPGGRQALPSNAYGRGSCRRRTSSAAPPPSPTWSSVTWRRKRRPSSRRRLDTMLGVSAITLCRRLGASGRATSPTAMSRNCTVPLAPICRLPPIVSAP